MATNDTTNAGFAPKDPEALAHNLARIMEEAGKAASAYLKPREEGKVSFDFEGISEVVKTLAKVVEYWGGEPERTVEAERRLFTGYMELWTSSLKRMMGEPPAPAAEPDPRDKRFADPEWSENQFFDFIKQFYLITSRWAGRSGRQRQGPRPAHPTEGRLLRPPDRQRPLAVEFRPHQPRASARDARVQRRQPRARHAHARRGHQGRRRRAEDPSVEPAISSSARTSPRRRARSSTRTTSASSSSTRRRPSTRAEASAPHRPAVDQQVLHPRPHGRRNPSSAGASSQGHTVFVISWVNPDKRQATQGLRALHARRASSRRSTSSRRSPAPTASTPSATASAERCSRHPRLHGRQRRRPHQVGDVVRHPGRFHATPATSRSSSTRSRSPTSKRR